MPLSFDATITTLLPPLAAGRQVELLPEDEATLSHLAERLFGDGRGEKKAERLGWLFKITPAHLEALEYLEGRKVGWRKHRVVIGGEQLGAQRLLRWKRELLPETIFVNEYGPTEAVVGCSTWTLEGEKELAELAELEGLAAVPIGRPIENVELYVLGNGQQLQRVNSIGELYIGGAGVARGYVKQDELTAELFVRSPLEDRKGNKGETGNRLYRTGDLVKWLPIGDLLYVGRLDRQVKVRGYRIEPEEIEVSLAQHPSIREAAVATCDVGSVNRALVAYVVPRAPSPSEQELRSFLSRKLPEYMLPATYVFLPRLPLNSNGKLDRAALPIPDARTPANTVLAPRNNLEFRLLKVWERVLNRRQIGVDENFFDLGGDSLTACQLLAGIEQAFDLALLMNTLFEAPTIEKLAATVAHPESVSRHRIFAIQPTGSKPPFFCIGAGPLFRNLALHLGLNQPFLGLPVPGPSIMPPDYTLGDLAAHCIQTLEATQPAGPYFLGGWSDSGILACEVASQLRDKGAEVALLVLFDVENPAWLHDMHEQANQVRALAEWCALQVRTLRHRSASEALRHIRFSLRSRGIWLLESMAGWNRRMRRLPDFDDISRSLISSYRPRPYAGDVVLFQRGIRTLGLPGGKHYGWDSVLASLEVYEMPGDHMDMFLEPGARRLAEKLRACLDRRIRDYTGAQPLEPVSTGKGEIRPAGMC
jgi:thioesterase domain-containing protein/acyl carrier protein